MWIADMADLIKQMENRFSTTSSTFAYGCAHSLLYTLALFCATFHASTFYSWAACLTSRWKSHRTLSLSSAHWMLPTSIQSLLKKATADTFVLLLAKHGLRPIQLAKDAEIMSHILHFPNLSSEQHLPFTICAALTTLVIIHKHHQSLNSLRKIECVLYGCTVLLRHHQMHGMLPSRTFSPSQK